jgi:hypothetical protein
VKDSENWWIVDAVSEGNDEPCLPRL